MARYYFVGDGYEVLACEAWQANAYAALKRILGDMPYLDPHCLKVYECDPSEVAYWPDAGWDWAHPAEHAAAIAAGYELPTLAEALERQGINAD